MVQMASPLKYLVHVLRIATCSSKYVFLEGFQMMPDSQAVASGSQREPCCWPRRHQSYRRPFLSHRRLHRLTAGAPQRCSCYFAESEWPRRRLSDSFDYLFRAATSDSGWQAPATECRTFAPSLNFVIRSTKLHLRPSGSFVQRSSDFDA